MKPSKILVLFLITFSSYARAPFKTLIKEPRVLKVEKNKSGEKILTAADAAETKTYFQGAKKVLKEEAVFLTDVANDDLVEPEKKEIDFFKNSVLFGS